MTCASSIGCSSPTATSHARSPTSLRAFAPGPPHPSLSRSSFLSLARLRPDMARTRCVGAASPHLPARGGTALEEVFVATPPKQPDRSADNPCSRGHAPTSRPVSPVGSANCLAAMAMLLLSAPQVVEPLPVVLVVDVSAGVAVAKLWLGRLV